MMRAAALTLLALALHGASAAVRSTSSFVKLDLNAAAWDIFNQNETTAVGPVALPKMVLQALYEEGALDQGDPLAGYNDRNYRWVADETWTFQADFDVSDDILGQTKAELVLSGVDTIAEVYVNDQLVAELNNAHREYRVDVKKQLMKGTNLISIVFSPAPDYARTQSAEYPYVVPMQTYLWGIDHFNFIRKPASDFGWDWGPAFSPSGVYGNVTLEAYSAAYLTGATIRQVHQDDGSVDVYFDAVLQAAKAGETGVLSVAADSEEGWSASEQVDLPSAGENVVTVKVTLDSGAYQLWWPAGWGEAVLYDFTVKYTPSSGKASELPRRLGVRTIELVQEPLRDPDGLSYYFRVNGIPLYARGANMIPLDIFQSRTTDDDLRAIVDTAVSAGMNMLRIWGGGRYQGDAFYDAADEAGLLVWQEAMFACAQYPRDRAFLSNIAAEVTYQARRLGHHASLALWGGNNEVEASFNWFPESRAAPQLFATDFTAIFVGAIREALLAVDENVNYVDTSPYKGVHSSDPYVKKWGNVGDVAAGDVHFYDYSSNCIDPAVYPRAKFVSEYGYQSFPSFSVYQRYTQPRDWSIQSNMSDYRQRHPNGNAELQTQMQFHFHAISYNSTDPEQQKYLFQLWIYLTQVQQSQCYETAIAQWRRLKTAPDARTMGVLYWQLNDIWAGPSWSGMDYGGHWRLLMYTVKRLFNPVMVSGRYNATQADALSAYVTNDQPWDVSGNITVEVISWDATEGPLVTRQKEFYVPALDSKVVSTLLLKPVLAMGRQTIMDAVVRLKISAKGNPSDLKGQKCQSDEEDPFTSVCSAIEGVASNGKRAPESYESSQVVWLTEAKEAALKQEPNLAVSDFQQVDSDIVSFKVSSEAVAAFVQLDTDAVDGVFSDNGLLVLPWEPVTITFRGRDSFQAAELERSLSVVSLADTLGGGVRTQF